MNRYEQITYKGHHINIYYDDLPEVRASGATSARSTRHTGVTVPKRSSTNISTSTKYATAVPETFGNHSCKNMSL